MEELVNADGGFTDGMLLPPLRSQEEYVNFAKEAGLSVLAEPFDISKEVSKTW
jgi:tocopherol O-methyltransferase